MDFPVELKQAFYVLSRLDLSKNWSDLTLSLGTEYQDKKFEVISWLSYLIKEFEDRGVHLSDDLKAHGKVPISSKKLEILKEFCNGESVNFILVTIAASQGFDRNESQKVANKENEASNGTITASPMFKRGSKYTRNEAARIVRPDNPPKGGDWDTGYARIEKNLFVFMNIGVSGKTGHNFENYYDEESNKIIWFSKPNKHSSNPLFQKLVSGELTPYFFARWNQEPPFTFLGTGSIQTLEDDYISPQGYKCIRLVIAVNELDEVIAPHKPIVDTTTPIESRNSNAEEIKLFDFKDYDENQISFLVSHLSVSTLNTGAKNKLLSSDLLRIGEFISEGWAKLRSLPSIGNNTLNEFEDFLSEHGFNLNSFRNWPSEETIVNFLSENQISDKTYFTIDLSNSETIEEVIEQALLSVLKEKDAVFLGNRHRLNDACIKFTYENLSETDYFPTKVSRQRVEQILRKLQSQLQVKTFKSELLIKAERLINESGFLTEKLANSLLKENGFTKKDYGFLLILSAVELGIIKSDLGIDRTSFKSANLIINKFYNKATVSELKKFQEKLRFYPFLLLENSTFSNLLHSSIVESMPSYKIVEFQEEKMALRIFQDLDSTERVNYLTVMQKIFFLFEKISLEKLFIGVCRSIRSKQKPDKAQFKRYLEELPFLEIVDNVVTCTRRPARNRLTEVDTTIIELFQEYGLIIPADTIQHKFATLGKGYLHISQILMFSPFFIKLTRGTVNEPAKYEFINEPKDINTSSIKNENVQDTIFKIQNNIGLRLVGEFDISDSFIEDGSYDINSRDGTFISTIEIKFGKICGLQNLAKEIDNDVFRLDFQADTNNFILK